MEREFEKQIDFGNYAVFIYSIPFKRRITIRKNIFPYDNSYLFVLNAFGIGVALNKKGNAWKSEIKEI
jgi:hypothetical protein